MRDFTSGNELGQILAFSVPMLVGNVFQQVYSMVDAVVVGRYVGGTALAAVGVAMNVLMFLISVLIGLTTGASVLISQFYGAKQYDRLERAVSTSIVFLAAFSVITGVVGAVCARPILGLLGTSPDIIGDSALYLRVLMGGMLFPVFYNMYTAYLRALGDSKSPLAILICCTALNTALDLIFVLGFKLGVLGAAAATVISQAVSAALCYIYVRRRVPLLNATTLVFDRGMFRLVLKYGAPAAMQLSLTSLAGLGITRLINSFGATAMAGVTAATKIDQFALQPILNVSMALSTFVAQNMGAGKEERAQKGFASSLRIMLLLAGVISAVLLMSGARLMSLFVNRDDPNSGEILDAGLGYLHIIVVFYFLFAVLFAFNGFFRGAGDAVIAMVFPVMSLIIRTASAYMLVGFAGMGTEALAWSIPVGWAAVSLLSAVYYKKRLWAGKAVM